MCCFRWLVCSLFFFSVPAFSQVTVAPRQPRILLLLDGSASMQQPWSGEGGAARFATASRIIETLMDSVYSVNPNVEFALRVYGHQYGSSEANCYDTRREVIFTKNNRTQMALRLAALRPQGVSPIAYSIRQAAVEDFDDALNHSYALILITDGGESCGGDICAATQAFLQRKIFFKPWVVGLSPVEGLRAQYTCLGQYLQVTKEGELRPAVGTIVEDYRRALTVALKTDKLLPTTPVPAPRRMEPKITVVPLPAVKPEPKFDLAFLQPIQSYRTFPLRYSSPVYRVRVAPRIAAPPPEARVAEPALAVLRSAPMPPYVVIRPFARGAKQTYKPGTFALPKPEPQPVVAAATPPPVRPVPVPKPDPKPVVVVPVPKPVVVPATPKPTAPKPAAPKPVPAPIARTPKPAATPPAGPKVAEATITTEAAAESGLDIYFTDGRGIYYKSTPQMLLLDAKTGSTVQKFYRTLDPSGNPDMQKAAPGRYDVVVAGRANLIVRGVTVEPSKRTRVEVRVSRGSLKFGYTTDRKRPMSEFEALVNRRFVPGPVIRQRCTAELEYEPGNYYIEVNTTPISRHNIDLEFGVEMEILIPEPGWVQFSNAAPVGFVALYHQLGDRYVRFAAMNVEGRPDTQKMRLQPGAYEAHWIANPNVPYAKETVMSFFVKSDKVTEVELR